MHSVRAQYPNSMGRVGAVSQADKSHVSHAAIEGMRVRTASAVPC